MLRGSRFREEPLPDHGHREIIVLMQAAPDPTSIIELTDDLLPVRFTVDEAELAAIDNESEFLRVSFELLKEAGHWLIILADLATPPLPLHDAIIRAHTVRLMKIT